MGDRWRTYNVKTEIEGKVTGNYDGDMETLKKNVEMRLKESANYYLEELDNSSKILMVTNI